MDIQLQATAMGAVLTAFGAIVMLFFNIKIKQIETKKNETKLFISFENELIIISDLLKVNHCLIIKDEKKDGIFHGKFPVNESYCAFFDSNLDKIISVENQSICLEIQKVVLLLKSYFETVKIHNEIIDVYIEFGTRYKHTNNDYDEDKYKRAKDALGSVDIDMKKELESILLLINKTSVNLKNEVALNHLCESGWVC